MNINQTNLKSIQRTVLLTVRKLNIVYDFIIFNSKAIKKIDSKIAKNCKIGY